MHQPIPLQGAWLRQVVTGHFAYYAVPTNSRALSAFRHWVSDPWRRTLRRRSQKEALTWDRMAKLIGDWCQWALKFDSPAIPVLSDGGEQLR